MKSKLSHFSFFVAFLLNAYGCFLGPPAWVEVMPVDKEYYHGVGYASKSDHKNPKEISRTFAINEVASQIKINVTSDMEIIVKDLNGNIDNMIESAMKSRFDLLLPDLEFIGHHSTRNGDYFYVRMHKATYRETMKRLRRNATSSALEHIRLADNNLEANSFSLIQKAWQEILPFHDEPIEVPYNNERHNLYSLIKRKIEDYNSRLLLSAELESSNFKTFIDRGKYVKISVRDKVQKNPIRGLPLKIKTLDGTSTYFSDANGIVQHDISIPFTASSLSIEYSVDVDSLFSNFATKNSLIKINPTVNTITARVLPARALIVSTEKNLNKVLEDKIIEPAIKKYMNDRLEFVSDDPDIKIIIESNTIKKSRRMGSNFPYFTFGNTSVGFKEISTDKEFFNINFTDVKGADFDSQEIAGVRAYDEMVQQLNADLDKAFKVN